MSHFQKVLKIIMNLKAEANGLRDVTGLRNEVSIRCNKIIGPYYFLVNVFSNQILIFLGLCGCHRRLGKEATS